MNFSGANKTQCAIAILGGGLVQDKKGWHTIGLGMGGDIYGVTCDSWRVLAASYLWREDTKKIIIASGGKGQLKDNPDAPTISEIIKKELVELGVSEKKIVEETASANTFQQLKILVRLAKEMNIARLTVISNDWHLPRVKIMFEYAPGIKTNFSDIDVEFISAEEILLKQNAVEWGRVIDFVYSTEEMKKRIILEQKGIDQIKAGTYRFA